ncbi:hypothetical protein HPB48_001782 [Haemaphysalis longicornis]|uniref:DUF155 domain-containing protein n=1 Tax=Haemaphysalis longicornis TaxID=44386 RepID=A0A9J6GS52_HAELO|nr:hypothetical protein HPB48_001782 [Haemaphysalis longicornis]
MCALSLYLSSKSSLTAVAYSTAEEYNLMSILSALNKQGLYKGRAISEDLTDVLYASAKYQVGEEPRELFFFREGSVVFWNFPEIERKAVLQFLKPHEHHAYSSTLVDQEVEALEFVYHENKTKFRDGNIFLSAQSTENDLEKYTFSSGLALSVKLAIWEASLDTYVESIEGIIEDMKEGRSIKMTREQVFRKTGELFSLRHLINLSSDLLDTPDFYWDRPALESLYLKVIKYMNISRRTKVMNEKLTHCCELMELLSHHLEDKHHVRLEVMIIVLIMVETAIANCFAKFGFGKPSKTLRKSQKLKLKIVVNLELPFHTEGDFVTANNNLVTCGSRAVEDIAENHCLMI